ncbi:Uncharacterized protein BP5553_04913 [Venustampulla echinocandica]|uniref:Zn(2)-C6 fungal-type domain-containing protein n=1 Tax=Venustampulla echinocandica TaxID=2656787 RepID=A0A370TPN5_9HELO|nr:Uncharacterized protein BP5553_04913 [Venustampulla echinocandica]RDL37480.1 Uncharacterized protein BP5553_04913 [Venustampulla echinocandica]
MDREPRRRRRLALSCLECQRRKVKCDRNNPCGRCTSFKSQCTYKANGDLRQPRSMSSPLSPSTNAPPPSVQVAQFETNRPAAEGARHSFEFRARTIAPDSSPSTTGRSMTGLPSRAQATEQDIRELIQRVQRLEESSVSSPVNGVHRPSETNRDIPARQSGLEESHIIFKKTRVSEWGNWLGMAPEFAKIITCFQEATEGNYSGTWFQDPETGPLVTQACSLIQKCGALIRSIKAGRPSRSLYPGFSPAPPSREVADMMVPLYFRSFESTYRILHVPSFWAEYQRYWDNPDSVTTGQRLKILLVIGIGSSLHGHGDRDAEFRNMAHQWVCAAQTWLSGPLEKDRLDITGLQVHCLTILARYIFSIGDDLVWMSMGSLIHRAMHLGLHRDPKHLPAMPVLQAELRRRLWATILEMVVQASLDSEMPPRLSLDEFDTEAPSNNNDHEMDESTIVLEPNPKGTYTTASMQLILLDSLPTRLRIVQLLNGLHSELSYVDVLKLSSDIVDACRACSTFIKENEGSGVTAFHRNLLDFIVRRLLIPLHGPFASKARANPLFYYSYKISLDTAIALISPEPDEGFSHLMALGGGLLREGIKDSATTISLELIAQAEAQSLDGTLDRNSQYRETLKQAVRDRISLSVVRIRHGETNIKIHAYLSMIVAHVEAIESGSSCELKIVQSVRDSLVFCHGLLEEQASAVSLPSSNDMDIATSLDSEQEGFAFDFDLGFFGPDVGFQY